MRMTEQAREEENIEVNIICGCCSPIVGMHGAALAGAACCHSGGVKVNVLAGK